MEFHFNSWLVYFYFYCICGWIFESLNVSIRQRKWVNRGFMKGPWLPLYGSGALVILFSTLPFKEYPVMVYFAAAVAAITGKGVYDNRRRKPEKGDNSEDDLDDK